MAHLSFHVSGTPLFLHLLKPGRTVIGRSDRCDLALPSESVSRTHCVFERRLDGWWLADRSRHGTRVNGSPVESWQLADGDELGIGIYTARFSMRDDGLRDSTPTLSRAVLPAIHEELVEVTEEGFAAGRAEIRFTRGPLDGRSMLLQQVRTSMGGTGATIALDATLPRQALHIRVVRGRAMIEPGEAASFLAGVRVRQITPVHPGEEVRVGDHVFAVNVATVEETASSDSFGEMVGKAPAMCRLFGILTRIAAHDAPILLTGESGTGKELAARGIHDASPRSDGPFVAVNCAAIPETLVESELFGHEKGAFTGAAQRQDGAFHRAAGGTLFLDEIGELRLEAQAALLRALESGEVRRVGAAAPEFPDCRVVAATNRNLAEMVSDGSFREDLYFRLAVLTVRLPALRERREDLGTLARTLLGRQHPGAVLTDDAVLALQEHDWPGNVRELRNVLTRAFVMNGRVIAAEHLSFNPWAFDGESAPRPSFGRRADEPERRQLLDALKRANGNRTHAANALGIPRSSLLYKMKRLGIEVR